MRLNNVELAAAAERAGVLPGRWSPGIDELPGNAWRLSLPETGSVVAKRLDRGDDALRLMRRLGEDGIAPVVRGYDALTRLAFLEDVQVQFNACDVLSGNGSGDAVRLLAEFARKLAQLNTTIPVATLERIPRPEGPSHTSIIAASSFRPRLEQLCALLGVAIPASVWPEVADAEIALNHPLLLGVVHGDVCLDNFVYGAGRWRFLDFDWVTVSSVAADLSALAASFPTCWCVGGISEAALAEVLGHYVDAFAAARGPEAAVALTAAVAPGVLAWALWRCEGLIREIDEPEDALLYGGVTTVRQRAVSWLFRWVEVLAADPLDRFTEVRRLLGVILEALLKRWGPVDRPTFAAFAI